jgi:molecular chaperone DnaK (HSP70)
MNPTHTVFDAKRIIGRKFSDPIVQSDMKPWSFKVIQGDGDRPTIQLQFKGESKQFFPDEISAIVLWKMKEIAEIMLSEKISDAVVTVPAYFTTETLISVGKTSRITASSPHSPDSLRASEADSFDSGERMNPF